jgi:hypothetical protein
VRGSHGQHHTIVLLPQFTALAGEADFVTAPINVRDFSHATFTFWRGGGFELDDIAFKVEISLDLASWEQVDLSFPSDDQQLVTLVPLATEWVRLKVSVEGDDPTVCVWAIGQFLKRDGVA